MRTFIDVLRFELRMHMAAPIFWGISFIFFLLHLLTMTRTGINLGDNEQVAINSASLIFQTEMAIGFLSLVPSIVFVVIAMTRDHERHTAELFFTTPAPSVAFVLGRFSAATSMALLIGTVSMLGALTGSFMPWVDPARVLPFTWQPWVVVYVTMVIPNLLVFCALFFAVAALTRSSALTFCLALCVLVLEVVLFAGKIGDAPLWMVMAEPFGGLAISEVSRYWTVDELNTLMPTALLLPNRLLWLSVSLAAVAFTVWRYRMQLPESSGRRAVLVNRTAPQVLPLAAVRCLPHFDMSTSWHQLAAQMRMDWRGVWQSPMFWIVLVLTLLSTWDDGNGLIGNLVDLPLYPVTSLMLGFFRFGLVLFLITVIFYFAAALVYRERDSSVDGIVSAIPCPDWVPMVSKTLVLCCILALLFLLSIAVSLGVQEAADFHDHSLLLFLQGVLVYNGFHFWMLAVLSILVLILSPGRWSGMVLVLLLYIALASLPQLGFEHQLYGFGIPYVVHSDMNGFGHFQVQTWSYIVYWAAFCVLLMLAGHLLYPRGYAVSWRERLGNARMRLSTPVLAAGGAAAVVFVGMGVFIFYNTNVLNDYVTREQSLAAQAQYEIDYGQYRDLPQPSLVDPDLQMDLYASERRLVSRGTAGLRNNKQVNVGDFVLSVEKHSRVQELTVDGATLVLSDPAQGFYLFRPDAPFEPGNVLNMHWQTTRENRGFVNSDPDNAIVHNGSYLMGNYMVPAPSYCTECELATDRERFGLPPAPRIPELGDPQHLDDLWPGLSSRSRFHVVYSTDADQTAVGPGVLNRSWEENGRRYFEYSMEEPAWPLLMMLSARYQVARDNWNGIALEVYHDEQHPWNVQPMLETAKKGLAYYSREFAPYPLPYYRMAEYARYRTAVQAGTGLIAYSEASGFVTDLRNWAPDMDYATLHELAHQWWGNVYGANMQGRQFLNEGLAQYSTFMAYKEYAQPQYIRRILRTTHNGYLNARSSEAVAELPVYKTEDQGYISYSKAPLALFALQEMIGADKVNGALSAYHARFLDMKPPFPTSLDLLAELRKAAGPGYDRWITDQFEKVMLYDVGVELARVEQIGNEYEITLQLQAHQFEADGLGAETQVPLDSWFQVALFADAAPEVESQTPVYLQFHRLQEGQQQLKIRVAVKPRSVVVDPYFLMLDRRRENNMQVTVE